MIQKGDLVRFIAPTFNVDRQGDFRYRDGISPYEWEGESFVDSTRSMGAFFFGGYWTWTYGSLKVISGKVASSYSLACQTTKKAN